MRSQVLPRERVATLLSESSCVTLARRRGVGGYDHGHTVRCVARVGGARRRPALLAESAKEWQTIWDKHPIRIETENFRDQLAIRFAQYHLHVMTPAHDERMNIGAKGMSGEGYKGHTFWDTEIFMLPYFSFTHPEIAKSLVTYRYLGLDGAHKKAASNKDKPADEKAREIIITPDGNIRRPFFLAYDEENCEYFHFDELSQELSKGRDVVSAMFVIPYPPGFPILVPGQVVSQEILDFMGALDVKEIHGYRPELGFRVFTEQALQAVIQPGE